MDNGCILCEQRVQRKVPIAIQTEPHVWVTWYVPPELAEQLSKLLKPSDKFVSEVE